MAQKDSPAPAAPSRGGSSTRDFFIGFFTGIFLTGLTGAYFVARKSPSMRHAQDATAAAIIRATATMDAKLEAWHLNTDDIQQELD